MRVFLDANVLFTAAQNPRGKAALVITLGSEGLFQLATSAYAREEARRNLERKAPDRLAEFRQQLSAIRLVADNHAIPCPADLAEKDWPIYRAAHACKATVLLTGDHHDFGFLMNAPELANGLLIQPVADFLAVLGTPVTFRKDVTPWLPFRRPASTVASVPGRDHPAAG